MIFISKLHENGMKNHIYTSEDAFLISFTYTLCVDMDYSILEDINFV